MDASKYDKQHLKQLATIQREVERLFSDFAQELARLGIHFDAPLKDQPFSFRQYPQFKAQIDNLFNRFQQQLDLIIKRGYQLAENRSEAHSNDLRKQYALPPELKTAYTTSIAENFKKRVVGGMNLSQRVWNIKEGFYKEVEDAFDIALRDGTPAESLATELKQYLKHPDKLFRRVRDQHGQLHLSKHAQAFHPGRGVYRSSYRNARRLAVTEINMAYHTAEHDRWQQLDFVLGYEVKVSGTNPNVCPVCLELEGRYPKEFKFVGWHPHCRCHALPILEKPEEFKKRQEALRRGVPYPPPLGAVTKLPDNFTSYLAKNRQRIATSRNLPYFVKDNNSYIKYQSHDAKVWELMLFSSKKGYLVRHRKRTARGRYNKQERYKLEKETRMARTFAEAGYRVEMLEEVPRVAGCDAIVNGKRAEFKSLTSYKTIVKRAKHAIDNQGAEMVLFEFNMQPSEEIEKELDKIRKAGIRGLYYYEDESKIHKL